MDGWVDELLDWGGLVSSWLALTLRVDSSSHPALAPGGQDCRVLGVLGRSGAPAWKLAVSQGKAG